MGWPKGISRKGYKNGTMSKVLAKRPSAIVLEPSVGFDNRLAVVKRQSFSPYEEVGYTGLKQISGFLQEEFINDLRGQKGARIYREMVDNNADLGAFLQLVKRLLQQVQWRFEPFSAEAKHVEQAEWFDEALEDMEHSWPETLSEITSMLQYGYAPMEVTLKIRRGWSKDTTKRSKFDDGLIGWRKISLRAQDSVWQWVYDKENREILAMSTLPPPLYTRTDIPMDKILNFRMDVERDNPEGRSILRSAYQDYYLTKRLTAIAAIGAERNLAGIPVMYIPAECMRGDASPAEQAVYRRARQIVENLRVDEQAGLVMPQQFDVETKQPLYKIELLSVSGTGKGGIDVDAMIKRHQTNMLRAVLADWLMLGTGDTGSWALSSDRTDQFSVVLGGIMDIICGVMNRQAIPALATLNGWDINELPTLEHGDVESPDLEKLGNYIQKTIAAGAIIADGELEDYLREAAHLPVRTETDDDTGIRTRIVGGDKPEPPQPGTPPQPGESQPKPDEEPEPAEDQVDKGWVTINGRHVFIDGTERSPRGEGDGLDPNGKSGTFTPEDGGQLFHGTRRTFSEFGSSGEIYLTDDYDEAVAYALGKVPGTGSGGQTPQVRTVSLPPGQSKTLDLDLEDIEGSLESGMASARQEGMSYVQFWHPSAYSEKEQLITVSLKPSQLRLTGGWKIKKSIKKTPPWKVVQRAGKWLVIGSENGKTYGTHDSKQKALANMAALYANVPDAKTKEEK